MILALESSCDETAVALFEPGRGIAGEWVHSQVALHGRHGGVVPDLAAREHLRNFGPLLARARAALGGRPVAEVAVTRGPGLAPCLALGVAAAKALALELKAPLAGANHLRAHAWSPFIPAHASAPAEFSERLSGLLPHLGLIVSGGHTLLLAIGADRRLEVLSSTRDDAAGEALDKGAKLLGLGYPGGPLIERAAEGGRPDAYEFPRGLDRPGELDFSFSGLKTSLRYALEKIPAGELPARLGDLCASYQAAVIGSLAGKTRAALRLRPYRSLGLSGGVAHNRPLRAALAAEAERARVSFLAAEAAHAGDNAGMIGFAAWADPAGLDRSGAGLRIDPGLALA
ncbi:MAG TPA: tRNA (adenosine(37)-N6)-threonylcarbamoyltransferase complex transferase subunit TsaD [Opitutaceae bacterium]|nr:tRNA (adenosine(37)-N6)-threonylcarbamoyltransferase complex transferase subunit TsaD [Opitutaceae bacterium]